MSFRVSPVSARILRRSLSPEMRWRDEWHARLSIRGSSLRVEIDSRSLSRLRAATNTLLRWIEMVEGVIDLLDERG